MFTFNDKLYYKVMKPVTKVYNGILTEKARGSISNFFYNVTMPVRFVNAVLQRKARWAGNELARFGINTTLGIGGLFDPARDRFHIPRHDEDLGITLAYYGIGSGPYVIWPFLGPSTIRDSVGKGGDGFVNPIDYLPSIESVIGVQSYQFINETSISGKDYEDLTKEAIEPYVALRNAYLQHRKSLIENTKGIKEDKEVAPKGFWLRK